MSWNSAARDVLRRRSVRRLLVGGLALTVALIGLSAASISGALVVRDGEGCPRSVGSMASVSWVDVLHIQGRTYERVDIVAPHESTVAASELGEQIGTIQCTIAEAVQAPGYDLRDGEATFLTPGTPVHELSDTEPNFRVAAIDSERPAVYEHRPSAGTSGTDLLPFSADDVVAVSFLSEVDGRTVLGELTDPQAVRNFVEELHAAPVGERPNLGEERRVFIALEFADQPPTTLVAYPDHAVTTAGLRLPDAVLEHLPQPDIS